MPDEIKQRLQESTEKCLKSYEAWRKDEKNSDALESLQEAIHEIRKVGSRLEIEIALSDRNQSTQKPMPIPQNRNAQGKSQEPEDNAGNRGEEKKPAKKVKLPPKKSDKEKQEDKADKQDEKKED